MVKHRHYLNGQLLTRKGVGGEGGGVKVKNNNNLTVTQTCNQLIVEGALKPFNHQDLTAYCSLKLLMNLLYPIKVEHWVAELSCERMSTVA